ncbi:MAG: apolipoprotein N-acyltransferase [Candidatus Xenobia bacterium]
MNALLAVVAGLGLALPYAWPVCWPLALLSLLGVLELERRLVGWCSLLGWCLLAGVVSQLAAFWWLAPAMVRYYRVPVALAPAFVALYCVLCGTRLLVLGGLWRPLKGVSWWGFPLAVVAADMLQLSLFPWTIGGTQTGQPIYLQLADVVGVVGMGFPLGMVAAWLHQRRWSSTAWVLAVLVLVYGYGAMRMVQIRRELGAPREVALIQPSSPHYRGWSEGAAANILSTCRTLTELSLASPGVDLVIWPEGGAPFSYDTRDGPADRSMHVLIDDLVSRYHVPLLFNDDRWEGGVHYNAVSLVDAADRRVGSYRKRILLPFAEFMPVASWACSAGTPQYTAGRDPVVFDGCAPELCYEILFPANLRPAILKGAEYIVNLSDDGWFGASPAATEHLQDALPRAIEFRRPLIYSTNTGISTVISPTGEFVAPRTVLGARTFLRAQVETVPEVTFYARFGDVFGWCCTALAVIGASLGLKNHHPDGIVAV